MLVGALLVGACQARTAGRMTAATGSGSAPGGPTTVTSTTLASPGCGRPTGGENAEPGGAAHPAGAGETAETVETVTVAGQVRSYRLTLPSRSEPGHPHPLILLFHGSGSDAAELTVLTQLPQRAASRGYVVAAPDARNHNWQVSPPNAPTADLQLVSVLVSGISARACIDLHRVYAAGFSLGSEFAAIAACAPAPAFAAIGLVAAEFLLKPCARPVAVIAFHGTADPAVPYQNGAIGLSLPGIRVRGVELNLGDWAALDGCSGPPNVMPIFLTVAQRAWPGCPRGTDVILYTIAGGGHAWPGPPLDATGRILEFFDRHPIGP
jgi:polyhydroxybutyrate depolymerase